jgi:cystathionine beta-lyase/cystathionine gamma-synthase
MTRKREVNSPRTPIYRDSGFELYDASTTAETFRNETENKREPELYIYSRYRNPTVVAAEEEILKLEKCKWALLTQSGMSAIDNAVSVFQNGKETRPWLFFTEIYGGTISYIDSILVKRRGLEIVTYQPKDGRYDLSELENTIRVVKPAFVYCETISNPLLVVADVIKIIEISKKYGVRVIVDNTFASPYLYRPLEHGADIVLHSATKYLSGHGNLTAGVVCGNDHDLLKSALEYRKFVGHMISPDDAYRLNTQIKTFRIRFRKQCENAILLSGLLGRSKFVQKVYFPGLKDHQTHDEALKLLGGELFGAMITIDFAGSAPDEKRLRRDTFIRYVSEKIKLIPTLGDPQTILMPVESVWGAKYPEPGMLRLSVGFEEYDELNETVANALERLE